MATYGYKAITKAGKEVKGSLEADNKDLAMAELRRQELTVIDLGEQSFLTKDIDIQYQQKVENYRLRYSLMSPVRCCI